MRRRWVDRLFVLTVIALLGLGTALTQTGEKEQEIPLTVLVGYWELRPVTEGTEPPPAPPIYASYRTKEKLSPLESTSRVTLRLVEGKLAGTAVFPEGILLTDDNRDVKGRPEVSLENLSFEQKKLSFSADVDGVQVDATVELERDRMLGKWKTAEASGDLFLVRRPEIPGR